MSLPNATKDISDHPAKGSVTEPINKQQQAADVDRKLRFYGVINAFKQSRMPTNDQIDKTLSYILKHSPVPETQLSPEGQKLVQDSRDIIETARLIVKEKNRDELFQNFVWHTRDTDFDQAKKDPNDVVPVDKDKAKSDGQQAVAHLRTLLSLILTNAEVRKLLSDFSVIGRDLLARGASKLADQARPDEEALRRVDESAPNDRFVTEGGRHAGPNETPVLEVRVPGTDTTVKQHPKDEPGTGATVERGDGTVQSGAEAKDEAANKANELSGQASEEAQKQADDINNVVNGDPVPNDREEAQEKKQGFKAKILGLRDQITDRIPQEHKDRVNGHTDRAKQFFTEEYFPEERRDQFIYRGKKVIVECQKHKDYQESIRWLLSYLEEYAAHGKTVFGHGKDSHQQLTSDDSLQQATSELRTLLERFANGMSLGVIGDAMRVLYDDAQRDESLRDWFKGVDSYIRKVLLEPGYVLEPDCNNEANRLRESGRTFYDDKYKSHFDNLFGKTADWFRALGEDQLNKRFGEDWARLTKDLLFDEEGQLSFKSDLWMDIRKVILPSLIEQVGYVPIPRIEYTDDSMDVVIENLALSGKNLFPNIVSIEAHNFIKFSPYNAITDETNHEFTFTLGQIQADMKDVAFYFKKKTGIPKITDSGLADVLLGGSGLTVTAHIRSASKPGKDDPASVFTVQSVNVKVDTLKFSIRDSKHDLLYKTLRPIATGLVKKQLQKAIEGAMFQRQKDEAESVKGRADEKHAHFKVVSKRDSVIVQQGHPSGWLNRAEERVQAAGTGHEWRSEAFTIVTDT
ncbi:hypothetical protein EUX98_g9201 [Antrodiella citrinella]|uniref:Uncharacterized protein n=1 Tax=Antrodiella citrinella TaxID=2447956 RepID=A0A4S4LWT7_9APHY|nr:hypothetical protein EUX98_g9201 [Antrodiella citrinella]